MKFMTILLEGKKERLIDKYKDTPTFADAPELLEKLIEGDPSSTKKYSEWMVKQMIGLGDPITYSLADNVNLFIELIEKFHKSASSITPEDIDDAASMSSLVRADKLRTAPKDINKYDSIWALQAVLSAISKRKEQKEKEKEVKNESVKIYEDDRFLIVEPLSHGASCYYGQNTKWCTTSKDDTRYFDTYTKEGSLYYIIDKKSSNNIFGKMALLVRPNGRTEVYDQQDSLRSVDVLLDRFDPIKDKIKGLIQGQNHYELLSKLNNGEIEPSRVKVQSEIFDKVRKSDDGYEVVLDFDGPEKFLSLFNEEIEESDISFIANSIDPPYGYEANYYDTYNFNEDLSEGYYLYNLNDEHLEILKDIIQVYNPEVASLIKKGEDGFDIDRDDYSTIGKFITDNLESSLIEDLGYEYSIAKNESIEVGLKKRFQNELCNILSEIGIEKEGECFYKYSIDLSELVNMYESSEYFKDLDLKSMLEDYVSNNVSFPYSYVYELAYDSEDDETFNENFNDPTESVLSSYYDKLIDSDFFLDVDEYLKINKELEKEFKLNQNIPVPSQEGTFVNISGVHPETNKVDFTLKRFNGETDKFETKKARAKLSTLRSLMNNYQLFDPFE